MKSLTRTFYQYLGLHSLLIGIFPFFIPVYLWSNGFGLGAVSLFIGAGGAGFCIGLWCWDRLRIRVSLLQIIGISLALEIILLLNVLILEMNLAVLLLLGISYGIYNCFFWTTQRALFLERIGPGNSGRRYGNLQIYVGMLLQAGILAGAYLLDQKGLPSIILVSLVVSIVGLMVIMGYKPEKPANLVAFKPISLGEFLRFRDSDNSRLAFIVDGIFLFLESFFWVISLFLLAHESFMTLGALVLSLAILFGVLFYLLKNTIDRLCRKRVYQFAVALYAVSWGLRGLVNHDLSLAWLFCLLVVITFCTSFFRLALNKRFFDLARETRSHHYLILKSYYSQLTIAVVFGLFGVVMLGKADSEALLGPIYWAAAVGALVFLGYGRRRYDRVEVTAMA